MRKPRLHHPNQFEKRMFVIQPITLSDARCVRHETAHCRYALASSLKCSLETRMYEAQIARPTRFLQPVKPRLLLLVSQSGRVKGLTSKVKFRFLLNFAFEASTHGSSRGRNACKKFPTPRWQSSSLLRCILPWSGVTTVCASSHRRPMASKTSGARSLSSQLGVLSAWGRLG